MYVSSLESHLSTSAFQAEYIGDRLTSSYIFIKMTVTYIVT